MDEDKPVGRSRRWLRQVLVVTGAVLIVVVVAALALAYLWWPSPDAGDSAYQMRVDESYVDTEVARFHYTKTGSGPPVVLVPGGTLWLYSYREIVPVLAEHRTVYAVDLPGQGFTTLNRQNFNYDLDSMSGALQSFIDALGLARTSLVGHSWGGSVSLYFAERHPDRVERLALIAAPALNVPSALTFRPLEFPVVGELFGKLMNRSMFADTLHKGYANSQRLSDADVDEYWLPLSRRANREAMWELQRNLDFDLTEDGLGELRVETLVLWGDQDVFDEPWQAAELGRRMPDATTRVLPGCGHNLHEDCPDRAITELNAFLATF